jgi:hypothetical protein
MKLIDLTGRQFHRLTVLSYVGKGKWLVKCSCDGNECSVFGNNLRRGRTKSCGCLGRELSRTRAHSLDSGLHHRTTHNLSHIPGFKSYQAMLARCYDPNHDSHSGYYADIEVCDRWRFGEDGKMGVECFFEDMGPKPSPEHSLDRWADGEGHYEPGNCRWATRIQQQCNIRNNVRDGDLVVMELIGPLSRSTGIDRTTLMARYNQGDRGNRLVRPVSTEYRSNTSGHTGVSFDKVIGKWTARIQINRTKIYLGRFVLMEDAIATRQAAELKYFGKILSDPGRHEDASAP